MSRSSSATTGGEDDSHWPEITQCADAGCRLADGEVPIESLTLFDFCILWDTL